MGVEKSETAIVPESRGNARGGKGRRVLSFQRREPHAMHRNGEDVFTKLQRIAALAKRDKEVKFTSLAHLLTPEMLRTSFLKLNQKGSPGLDGVTMSEYKLNLDENIDALWMELRMGKYRASAVRRVFIPKAGGKQRPLGIPTVKDRIVQRAVCEILKVIYEPYFCDSSYGFRPGRSCHQALEHLRVTIDRAPIGYVIDADVKAYFDRVNHKWMAEFSRHRITDRTILRLIAKWLRAGIMENGVVARSEEGTPQGGPLSPMLANIYLHYVLDLWFGVKIKPSLTGASALVRYADDFVVCFEHRVEAEWFLEELRGRLAAFNLELSEEKTKLVEFGKGSGHNGRCGPGNTPRSFDFLGFTHFMRKRGKRGFRVARKPSRKSRNKFLSNTKAWLVRNRDKSVWYHARQLRRKLIGYNNYFGLRYCKPALRHVKWHVERLWVVELRKRSQRHRLHWSMMVRYPWFRKLPEPKLR